jgi:hypothetical protein
MLFYISPFCYSSVMCVSDNNIQTSCVIVLGTSEKPSVRVIRVKLNQNVLQTDHNFYFELSGYVDIGVLRESAV